MVKATCNSMIKIFSQNFCQNFTVDEDRSVQLVEHQPLVNMLQNLLDNMQ